MKSGIRAFMVTLDCIKSIVFTTSPARAKWICVRSFWDAGYPRQWPQITVIRCPEYDNSPMKDEAGIPWNPKDVRLS